MSFGVLGEYVKISPPSSHLDGIFVEIIGIVGDIRQLPVIGGGPDIRVLVAGHLQSFLETKAKC